MNSQTAAVVRPARWSMPPTIVFALVLVVGLVIALGVWLVAGHDAVAHHLTPVVSQARGFGVCRRGPC